MKHVRTKQNLWRGLASVTASCLTLALAGTSVVNMYRTDIDKFLGTSSTRVETAGGGGAGLYSYASDYGSTKELVGAFRELGTSMSAEGSVLLKNNGALPLSPSEKEKISLLGFSSYYPVRGGDMGSILTENVGTDADTVDFVKALGERNYQINPCLAKLYEDLDAYSASDVVEWGQTITYHGLPAPMISGYFTSKEPSQELMNQTNASWKDSLRDYNVMIVTIARSAGENRTYLPGASGVDPTQNLNQRDALGLSDDERNLIAAAVAAKKENGGKVIVLLNNASAMEVQEIEDDEGVDAILQVGLPGGYGFLGVADILDGTVNPSGHLTDTYATANANAPSAQNFGQYAWTNARPETNMNSTLVEAEGLYTGYMYYETRYADCVLGQGNANAAVGSSTGQAWDYAGEVTYPFGFGLSYTTFEQTLDDLQVDLENKTVTATVTVKNTGDVAGMDVVQLYVSLPYTQYDKEHGVEKSAIQLLDYAKTKELKAGESQTLEIKADMYNMVSWDSTAANLAGTNGCYILDGGTYAFTVGNGAHDAVNNMLSAAGHTEADGMVGAGNPANVTLWELEESDTTTFAVSKNGTNYENQLEDLDLNYWLPDTVTYLSRSDWEHTFPKRYDNLTANEEMLDILDNDIYDITENGNPSEVIFGSEGDKSLADMKGVSDLSDPGWEELMNQITLKDCMIRTAFGGTKTQAIASIHSPEANQADGPNGVNTYELGKYANFDTASGDPCAMEKDDKNKDYTCGVMANETVIAQTFHKELAARYGELMGNYSLWSNTTLWWGVGLNLHRSPYNARNHEYFSEDAVLSAGQGAAIVGGAKKYGLIAVIKHVALNDTEIDRIGLSVFMTEQKAREGELRAMQAAIVDAGGLGIMTSYNRLGIYASNAHPTFLKNIVRGEWGFEGIVAEDYITDTSYASLKEGVLNGVSLFALTGSDSLKAVTDKFDYWTLEAVEKDERLLKALKQGMTWQAYALANSNAMDGFGRETTLVRVNTWYDNLLLAIAVISALLTVICLFQYFRNFRPAKQEGKKGGLFLYFLTLITSALGTGCYLVNCQTSYFHSLGIQPVIVGGMIAAVVLESLYILLSCKSPNKAADLPPVNLLPVAVCICLTLSLILFIGSRVMGFAAIITFDQNAANQKDLNSALVGIAFLAAGVVIGNVSSFCDIHGGNRREKEGEPKQ